MNRNNGREIGARLTILRDFLFSTADKTHAVTVKDIQREYGDPLNIKTIDSGTVLFSRAAGTNRNQVWTRTGASG